MFIPSPARIVRTVALTVCTALLLAVVMLLWFAVAQQSAQVSVGEEADAPSLHAATSTILFTGDVFLGRDVERITARYGTGYPLNIFDSFPEADAVVINFESAIPAIHVPTPDFGMQFSVHHTAVASLVDAGVTHASFANNHTYDYGAGGFHNTQRTFAQYGIASFGHPTQVYDESISIINTPHGLVGLVALHTLYQTPTEQSIRRAMRQVESPVSFWVAYVHWGNEYELVHSTAQRNFAEQLVNQGFDLIIGHHPHVVQDIQLVDGVPVVYSLGNAIFDQYFSDDVQQGLFATLAIGAKGYALNLHPITALGSRARPRHMSSYEAEEFLAHIADRSTPELAEQIRTGTVSW